jgi:tetratricopeptide (TPR) repeat protein
MELKIGEKIRRRRKQMRLTLKELAGDKVTPAQISAVEKGKCKPSSGLLEYIACKLEEEIEYFTLTEEERCRNEFDKNRVISQELYNEKKFQEAKNALKGMEDILSYLKDEQKGYYYSLHGNCSYDNKKYNDAFDLYVKSLTSYLKTKDLNTIANLYINIGNCLYKTKKYDMALGYYLSAYRYITEGIDYDIAARALYDTAICNLELKRFDTAKEFIEKCSEFITANEWLTKDKYLPGLFMMKGVIEREQKLNNASITKFVEAFVKYKQVNNYLGMGRAKNNEAQCLWDIGEKEKSIECFKEAIEYKSEGNDEKLVDTYINLAERSKEMHNVQRAVEIINSAEERVLNQGSVYGLIEIFTKKFEYLAELKDYDRAEISAFLALDYIQKTGDKKAESKLYIMLSEMHKNMGDERAAIEYLIKANKSFDY